MPDQVGGDLLHTMDDSRLSRVRTELQMLLIVVALPPHPVEADGQSASHRHLSDGPLTTLAQMDVATSPVGIVANGGLGCLRQQVAHQRVALLGDVPQSPVVGAGVFLRDETQVAADLLAAGEAIGNRDGSSAAAPRAADVPPAQWLR